MCWSSAPAVIALAAASVSADEVPADAPESDCAHPASSALVVSPSSAMTAFKDFGIRNSRQR